MKLRLIQTLFLLYCTLASANVAAAIEKNENKARLLWEQAIIAKGGRDQLHHVRSLSMSYEETVRNFVGIVVHKGFVERLYVFPDKSWEWDDGLPPPFRRTIRILDIEKDLRCYLYDAAEPTCRSAKQPVSAADEGLTQIQYLYLIETMWVKPVPMDVATDYLGFKKVDVIRTQFSNKRIDYYLDRTTHLPLRVAVFYDSANRSTLTIDISDYVNVGGIQMPQKQKRGRIKFQINPDYDEHIFTKPLSFSSGPKAWQRQ